MTDFFVRFVNTLDPNDSSNAKGATARGPAFHWPAYTAQAPQLLAFQEGATPLAVIQDTFRKEAIDFVMELSLAQPL